MHDSLYTKRISVETRDPSLTCTCSWSHDKGDSEPWGLSTCACEPDASLNGIYGMSVALEQFVLRDFHSANIPGQPFSTVCHIPSGPVFISMTDTPRAVSAQRVWAHVAMLITSTVIYRIYWAPSLVLGIEHLGKPRVRW